MLRLHHMFKSPFSYPFIYLKSYILFITQCANNISTVTLCSEAVFFVQTSAEVLGMVAISTWALHHKSRIWKKTEIVSIMIHSMVWCFCMLIGEKVLTKGKKDELWEYQRVAANYQLTWIPPFLSMVQFVLTLYHCLKLMFSLFNK